MLNSRPINNHSGKFFLFFSLLLAAIFLPASDLKGPYLGQTPPGSTPRLFGPGLISTEAGWEAAISFTPDLRELFFTSRASLEGTENRIMHMKMTETGWTKPQPASFARDIMENEAFVTPDNQKVVFNSKRAKPGGAKGEAWFSPRENGGWGEARYFTGPINDGWNMSITSTLDGTLYLTGSYGAGYGIYRSRPAGGEYAQPEFLPKEINKSKYFGASHPFIAPDESYLIFDAGQSEGNSELFISYRTKDGGWTEAEALGHPINTEDYEGIASVSPDRKYLFFQRNNDIYWVDAGIIKDRKPKE